MRDRAPQIHSSGAHRASVRERGRMRRRLREQRRMREALFLDLGALVFELQRQGRREPELLKAKAAELAAVDNEVRALVTALDAGHTVLELVATGVAGSCGSCGSLLSTDARYCSACGAPAVPSLGHDPHAGEGGALGSSRQAREGGAVGPNRRHEADGSELPALPAPGRLERIRQRARRRDPDG